MYSIQGLWTAAEFALPVAFIIVNNSSYRALEEFGRHFGIAALPGVQAAASRFLRARAKLRACKAIRVERCEDLDAALLRYLRPAFPCCSKSGSNDGSHVDENFKTLLASQPFEAALYDILEGNRFNPAIQWVVAGRHRGDDARERVGR